MMLIRNALVALLLFVPALGAAATYPMTFLDDAGSQVFDTPPQRVIALSWNGAENLLKLDISPLAIADVQGYRQWVVQPKLPEEVSDVGTRAQPNLERIAALHPDLILIGSQQSGLITQLQRIAPVIFLDSFRADHNNAARARQDYLKLGQLFNREALAHQRLSELDLRLETLAAQLAQHFPSPPAVTVVRLADTRHVLIYGRNSLIEEAIKRLGLKPGLDLAATTWGASRHPLTRLADVKRGALLYIEPFLKADALFATPLWNALPVAQGNRVAPVRSTWSYGGIFSVLYLAEAMTDSLLTLEPNL
ncbi:Ferrichrome-binding periplasmic protein precursor [Marinobacterium lacunae]|uniref:Ferrichrome-binding periplasmic protein n=1 Tax=Marinobacterium lacunae TaxID=1232683 RepID=A0A081FVT0_9GAMM|nr:iron-siderophore ABC transporter substrate-binding protein [Marinobacterium lacunae]KEA62635.1 Ferrichrome-binding periplasmic protein precursor [Marinobacterium lacunae]